MTLVIAAVWLAVPSGVKAKTLAWRLEVGGQYRMTITRTVRCDAHEQWNEVIRCQLTWTIEDVDEQQRMKLQQTLDHVDHLMEFSGGIQVAYDSRQDGEVRGDAAILARRWANLLQSRQSFWMTSAGHLSPNPEAQSGPGTQTSSAAAPVDAVHGFSVHGSEKAGGSHATTVAASSTLAPGSSSGLTTSAQSAGPLSDWVSPPKPMDAADWSLPQDELSVGDQWESATSVGWKSLADSLRLTVRSRYTGEETVDNQVLDRIDVRMVWEELAQPDAAKQLTIERQAGEGTVFFDAVNGHLARSQRQQDLMVRIVGSNGVANHIQANTALTIVFQPIKLSEPSVEKTADP